MKLVILDRDGVINQDSEQFIKSREEWQPLPGSIEAIARLNRAGFTVMVATNQSGLGRGLFTADDLHGMHHKMRTLIASAGGDLGGVYFCPHTPEDNCNCRKPLPGLLDTIMADLGLDSLTAVPLVGDSIRDLEAGLARGCTPLLVRTGKGRQAEAALPQHPVLAKTRVFDDLDAVADYLIADRQ